MENIRLTRFNVLGAVETAPVDMRAEDANVILVGLLECSVLHGHGQIAAGSASASKSNLCMLIYIDSD